MNDQTLLAIQTSVTDAINTLRSDVKEDLKAIKNDMKSDVDSIKKDIASINTEIAKINVTMNDDHKKLVGNGKKGLLERVSNIENVVSSGGYIYRTIISFIAWICATGIAIYAAIYK